LNRKKALERLGKVQTILAAQIESLPKTDKGRLEIPLHQFIALNQLNVIIMQTEVLLELLGVIRTALGIPEQGIISGRN
jgi:hypothetical protein